MAKKTQLTADHLKGNIVAIRQLISEYNLVSRENKKKAFELQKLRSENEYLRTSPYIGSICLIINFVSTLLIGLTSEMIGNELQSANGDISNKSCLLLFVGIILFFTGSFGNLFHPYAKDWFNAKKP